MELFKPNVSEQLAKILTKKLYGLEVLSIKRMNSYDDQNFHILVSPNHQNPFIDKIEETGYTLKITNTQKSAVNGHFESMHTLMRHQIQKDLRIPVPLKNILGTTWSLEKVPLLNKDSTTESKFCGVHVLSYICGSPIEDVLPTIKCTSDIFFQWGSLLAKYHNGAEDLICLSLKNKSVFWSLENIPKIKDCMDSLSEDQKELVHGVLNKYSYEVKPNLDKLPKGFIHGDFNQNNILVQTQITESGENIYLVDGILDFEDIHEGTYVWDVGVMLAYSMIVSNKEDTLEAPGYALAGYVRVRPLNLLEQSLVKICMECRMCQSLVLSAYSYQQDSKNTYLLKSAKTGWTRLRIISRMTNEDFQKTWKNIKFSGK